MSDPVPQTNPHLRLVGARRDDPASHRAVERENQAAAQTVRALDATDPRWLLAVRTQASLMGTALPPERRARLQKTADQLGVRPFDANVILAIVQDRARRGGDLTDIAPSLLLLEDPRIVKNSRRMTAAQWAAAIALAIVTTLLLIQWVMG